MSADDGELTLPPVAEEEEINQAIEESIEVSNVFVTSTGVTVEVSPMASQIVTSFIAKLPVPDPPLIEIPHSRGGSHTEKNYDDPDYLRKISERHAKVAVGIQNITLLKCVKILELPEGMDCYEEDSTWMEEYEAIFGMDPNDFSETTRHLEWLKWRVIVTEEDDDQVTEIARTKNPVGREEAAKLAESF